MDDTRALVPYEMPPPLTLDECIVAWLHEKFGRSGSLRTRKTYQDTLNSFRDALHQVGLELTSDARYIAVCAQGWAALNQSQSEHRREGVSANTYNLRISTISSFYLYAIRVDLVQINPMLKVARRVGTPEKPARYLEAHQVKDNLASIERESLAGLRDYALLSVAFETGRRASELAGLKVKHLHREGKTCRVEWVRCKGNKRMEDELQAGATAVLFAYLHAIHGPNVMAMHPDTPVWVSFKGRTPGKQLGYQAINDLCRKHLGDGRVHQTRHTWSHTMYKKQAPLHLIQKGLGHSSLAVTARYLEDMEPYENPYAPVLEQAFGIE
jgi:integrase/recombinase XerC